MHFEGKLRAQLDDKIDCNILSQNLDRECNPMTDFDEFGGMGDDVLLSMDLDNLVSPIAKKTAKKNMPCTPALSAKPSCAKEIMPSTPASSAKPSCSTDDPTPEAPVRTRKNAAKKQISLHRGIERQAHMV